MKEPHLHRPVVAVLVVCLVSAFASPTVLGHAEEPTDCPSSGSPFDPTPLSPPVFRCLGQNEDNDDWYTFSADAGDRIRAVIEPAGMYEFGGGFPESHTLCLHEDPEEYPVTCSDGYWNNSVLLEHNVQEQGTWYLNTDSRGGLGDEFLLSVTLSEQVESGTFLAGDEVRVAGDPVWNVDQRLGSEDSQGVDGDWVRLEQVATGEERVEVTHKGGPTLLPGPQGTINVYATMYDEDGNELSGYHCDHFVPHLSCSVPEGTAWVLVESNVSPNPAYELRYLH